jgi:uncharacterized membrane protein YphA (DoxX/SURF4 family)
VEEDFAVYAGTIVRWIVGAVLLLAGLSKLRALRTFSASLRTFAIVPHALVPPLAMAIPTAEVGLALLLLLGVAVHVAGAASALLFSVFGVAIVWNLRRGRHISCGCFGALSEPIEPTTVLRNVALASLSLIAATVASPYLGLAQPLDQGAAGSLPPSSDAVPLAFLALATLLLYMAFETLIRFRETRAAP